MKRAGEIIVVIFLPILFVIGMFRVLAYNGTVDFLPSYEDLYTKFGEFPDVVSGVTDAIDNFEGLNKALVEFRENMGVFQFAYPIVFTLSYAFNLLIILVQAVFVPIRVIWWVITALFGITFEDTGNAVEDANLRMLEIVPLYVRQTVFSLPPFPR